METLLRYRKTEIVVPQISTNYYSKESRKYRNRTCNEVYKTVPSLFEHPVLRHISFVSLKLLSEYRRILLLLFGLFIFHSFNGLCRYIAVAAVLSHDLG